MHESQSIPDRDEQDPSRRLAMELRSFAGKVVALARELPDGPVVRHIRDQLTRSGTAPGAHYAEARSAQSHADFTHKLSLAAKEARETVYWVGVVEESRLLDKNLQKLLARGDRLVGWLHASLRTARETKNDD